MATALVLASVEAVSKTPFYVAGGVLVAFALLLAAAGIARPETFPASKGPRMAVIGLCAVLVAAAMATAAITA
jgi:hypothetical protein